MIKLYSIHIWPDTNAIRSIRIIFPLLKTVLHGQLRGIDNSNFLIDSEQLEFFQQQMMLGIKTIELAGAWKGAVWSWGYLKSLHDF